jgi:hypothetical protein
MSREYYYDESFFRFEQGDDDSIYTHEWTADQAFLPAERVKYTFNIHTHDTLASSSAECHFELLLQQVNEESEEISLAHVSQPCSEDHEVGEAVGGVTSEGSFPGLEPGKHKLVLRIWQSGASSSSNVSYHSSSPNRPSIEIEPLLPEE